MKRRILLAAWIGGVAFALAACGGTVGDDAGIDAGMDVPVDVGTDTGLDVSPDVGVDVPVRDEGFDPGIEDPGTPDEGTDPIEDVEDAADEDPGLADADAGEPDARTDVCEPPDCDPCPDDGLECTLVYLDPEAGCVTALLTGWCLIDGACWQDGEIDPDDDCWACQPDWDVDDLTPRVDLACDDPTPCSPGGVCSMDGVCMTTGPICYDGIACTYDRCIDGVCSNPVKPSGECDDLNACTYNDHCDNGLCVGYARVCPVDTNPCTDDICDPIAGCAKVYLSGECDDGNGCTLDDTCVMGECVGDLKSCDDGDPCTHDSCQLGPAGTCVNTPHQGACNDGNECTASDSCATGECKGTPRTCNDGNLCTDDSCDTAVGCVYAPNSNPCSDTDPCTLGDTCVAGHCTGTPMVCDDGDECTEDACLAGACRFTPKANGSACDDGNDCTLVDQCAGGACVGSGVRDCNDGDPCTVESCQNEVGCVFVPAVCDDGNVCTANGCDPAVGCVYTPAPGTCNDNDLCTENDQCSGGVCTGQPKDCSDGDPCTLDLCNNGVCSHAPNLGACEDGNLCTAGETCVNAQCIGGTPITCNDLDVCTTDSCNPAVGCVFTPVAGFCDDYSVCTVNDKCVNGKCQGTPIVCEDNNFCTDNMCDPQSGCYFRNNGLLCDDGNACTFMDQCGSAVCAGFSYFTDPVSKAATLVFGTMPAKAGSGLDVDGNPSTCSPKNLADPDLNCADGVDNAFANLSLLIKTQFGPQLLTAVESGAVALLFEHEAPGPGAGPYEMNLFLAQRTVPLTCDPTKAGCNYKVYADTLVGTCAPRFTFPNATLVGGKLTAGGKEHEAIIYLVIGTARVPLTLKWARVEATVTLSGGKIVGGSGVLAGAIEKRELLNSLETVPSAQFTPYTRDNVRTNINLFLNPDLDVKGTGVKDYASIGLPFTFVTGHAVGRF